jgi:hypothetical protein
MEAIQSLQGEDDIDVDALLKEQQDYEKRKNPDSGKKPDRG